MHYQKAAFPHMYHAHVAILSLLVVDSSLYFLGVISGATFSMSTGHSVLAVLMATMGLMAIM